MTRSGIGMLWLCVSVIGLLASSAARAELQRVEAVGSYGIRDSMRSKVIPRDEAIGNALWEGVSRVALEVVGEAAGEDPALGGRLEATPEGTSSEGDHGDEATTASESLREALGEDILPYTRSFRILEDQGEQPVLFEERPEVATEYVVVVEVIVDVGRVTSALENAGWIDRHAAGPSAEMRIELIGLDRYEAFERVLTVLRESLRATRVQAVEFSRERQVVAVEGAFEPRGLEAWLAGFESPELVLEPVALDEAGRRIRVEARWTPEPESL